MFSILFNKPFVVVGNVDRGMSRFTSLLEMFGLNDRLFTDMPESQSVEYINWQEVNALLDSQRKAAKDFLNNLI